jgi:hypothetical protein
MPRSGIARLYGNYILINLFLYKAAPNFFGVTVCFLFLPATYYFSVSTSLQVLSVVSCWFSSAILVDSSNPVHFKLNLNFICGLLNKGQEEENTLRFLHYNRIL